MTTHRSPLFSALLAALLCVVCHATPMPETLGERLGGDLKVAVDNYRRSLAEIATAAANKHHYSDEDDFYEKYTDNANAYCYLDKTEIQDITRLVDTNELFINNFLSLDLYSNGTIKKESARSNVKEFVSLARDHIPYEIRYNYTDREILNVMMKQNIVIPSRLFPISSACIDSMNTAIRLSISFFLQAMSVGTDPTTLKAYSRRLAQVTNSPLDLITGDVYWYLLEPLENTFDPLVFRFLGLIFRYYEVNNVKTFLNFDWQAGVSTWQERAVTGGTIAPKYAGTAVTGGIQLVPLFNAIENKDPLIFAYNDAVTVCNTPPPSNPPTPAPSFGIVGWDEFMTVISVEDEASGISAEELDANWKDFRTNFPNRFFCLLQPKPDTADELKIPASFFPPLDSRTFYSSVKSDGGDKFEITNWFEVCGLARDVAIRNPKIAINLGVPASRVRASLDFLISFLAKQGIAVEIVGQFASSARSIKIGDWVTPLNRPFNLPNSSAPSSRPSSTPSERPSGQPSKQPSGQPSSPPSKSQMPSAAPSKSAAPSLAPSKSAMPSSAPSISQEPSAAPSTSASPSAAPSISQAPSSAPSISAKPSVGPSISAAPSSAPSTSAKPSAAPSISSVPSSEPSKAPSSAPSISSVPSSEPSKAPSSAPSISQAPSKMPSKMPSSAPSKMPSSAPSISAVPSAAPSVSAAPSSAPSISVNPSAAPSKSASPSSAPSKSANPSAAPSISQVPSSAPSPKTVSVVVADDVAEVPVTTPSPTRKPAGTPTAPKNNYTPFESHVLAVVSSENSDASVVESEWKAFREKYGPNRFFCLARPALSQFSSSQNNLKIPSSFKEDPNAIFVQVNQDNGSVANRDDWWTKCGFEERLTASGLSKIAINIIVPRTDVWESGLLFYQKLGTFGGSTVPGKDDDGKTYFGGFINVP